LLDEAALVGDGAVDEALGLEEQGRVVGDRIPRLLHLLEERHGLRHGAKARVLGCRRRRSGEQGHGQSNDGERQDSPGKEESRRGQQG
jgi:hypothetical protein